MSYMRGMRGVATHRGLADLLFVPLPGEQWVGESCQFALRVAVSWWRGATGTRNAGALLRAVALLPDSHRPDRRHSEWHCPLRGYPSGPSKSWGREPAAPAGGWRGSIRLPSERRPSGWLP